MSSASFCHNRKVRSPLVPIFRDIRDAKQQIERAGSSETGVLAEEQHLRSALELLCRALKALTGSVMQDSFDSHPGGLVAAALSDGELTILVESAISPDALRVIGGGLARSGWVWRPPPVEHHLGLVVWRVKALLMHAVAPTIAPSAPFLLLLDRLRARVCLLEGEFARSMGNSARARELRGRVASVATVVAATVGLVTGLVGFPGDLRDLIGPSLSTTGDVVTRDVDPRFVNDLLSECVNRAEWSEQECRNLEGLIRDLRTIRAPRRESRPGGPKSEYPGVSRSSPRREPPRGNREPPGPVR